MDPRVFIKRLLPSYICHRNYISKGNNEVSTVGQIIQIVLLAKVAFPTLPTRLMVPIGFFVLFTFWAIGRAWDWVKGYDAEAEWGNKRNPFVRAVKRKI